MVSVNINASRLSAQAALSDCLIAPKLPWSNQSFADPGIYEGAKQAARGNPGTTYRQLVQARQLIYSQEHFNVSIKHRRARYLLQSAGEKVSLSPEQASDHPQGFLIYPSIMTIKSRRCPIIVSRRAAVGYLTQ